MKLVSYAGKPEARDMIRLVALVAISTYYFANSSEFTEIGWLHGAVISALGIWGPGHGLNPSPSP